MILTNPSERSRFFRFAIVGIIGAIIDFGIFNLQIAVLGIPSVVASIVSFTMAVISNFLLNRFWTYPDSRSKRVHHQMIQFVLVSVIGLAIRTPIFALSEPNLIRLFSSLSLSLPVSARLIGHNFALAIAIVVVMFWNFFANRYWTYADVK